MMWFDVNTSDFNNLVWRDPSMFYLALIPVIIWLTRSLLQRNGLAFADKHLRPWAMLTKSNSLQQRIFSKATLYMLAWILFSVAAAGPRQSIETGAQQQHTNMDIMLVVDVSRSMHATDVFPSRLQRAYIEIEEFLARAKGARVGVIVFTGRPHVFVPLTADHTALRFYLNTLNTLSLPTYGSEADLALELARVELKNSLDPSAIILISDGDFSPKPNSLLSNAAVAATDIPVYVLGIGHVDGEGIQLDNGKWLEYDEKSVVTALNETALKKIARASGSKHYSLMQDDDADWKVLFDEGVVRQLITTLPTVSNDDVMWKQLYHPPLFLAILLLWLALVPYSIRTNIVYSLQSLRRRLTESPLIERLFREKRHSPLKTMVFFVVIILLNISPPTDSLAKGNAGFSGILSVGDVSHSQAFKNYSSKQYSDAVRQYGKLNGYAARFGEASSQYQLEKYNAAILQFSRAVLLAQSDSDRAAALYNLGNSYFKVGDYKAAITVYQDVFRYNSNHKKSLHNLDFSKALKAAVDKRLAADQRKARASDGPQYRAGQSSETNPDQSISINEGSNTAIENRFKSEFSVNSMDKYEILVQQGLRQVRLASRNDITHQLSNNELQYYQASKLDFINARLRMKELDQQQNLLWKRIFELEEGFPALLDEPQQIPGVRPW